MHKSSCILFNVLQIIMILFLILFLRNHGHVQRHKLYMIQDSGCFYYLLTEAQNIHNM